MRDKTQMNNNNKILINKKVVLVGDKNSGVSSLITSYLRKILPSQFLPDTLKETSTVVTANGVNVNLTLVDAAANSWEERCLHYLRADVVVICFSVENPISLLRVYQHWISEVKMYCPKAPIVLVCNKIDLRDSESVIRSLLEVNLVPVSKQCGHTMSATIDACEYHECSALLRFHVDELFERIALLSVGKTKKLHKKKEKCTIL